MNEWIHSRCLQEFSFSMNLSLSVCHMYFFGFVWLSVHSLLLLTVTTEIKKVIINEKNDNKKNAFNPFSAHSTYEQSVRACKRCSVGKENPRESIAQITVVLFFLHRRPCPYPLRLSKWCIAQRQNVCMWWWQRKKKIKKKPNQTKRNQAKAKPFRIVGLYSEQSGSWEKERK